MCPITINLFLKSLNLYILYTKFNKECFQWSHFSSGHCYYLFHFMIVTENTIYCCHIERRAVVNEWSVPGRTGYIISRASCKKWWRISRWQQSSIKPSRGAFEHGPSAIHRSHTQRGGLDSECSVFGECHCPLVGFLSWLQVRLSYQQPFHPNCQQRAVAQHDGSKAPLILHHPNR